MSIKVRNENKEFVETYNKEEIDTKVGECAKKTETYSKTEVDTKVGNCAKKSETYSKTEVDTKVGNCIIKGDFAVVSGNLIGSDSPTLTGTLTYPEGYNQNNCIVVGCKVKHSNKNNWGTGSTFNSTNLFGSFPLYVYLNENDISINIRDIKMLDGETPTISNITGTYNIKIVLMKIA